MTGFLIFVVTICILALLCLVFYVAFCGGKMAWHGVVILQEEAQDGAYKTILVKKDATGTRFFVIASRHDRVRMCLLLENEPGDTFRISDHHVFPFD